MGKIFVAFFALVALILKTRKMFDNYQNCLIWILNFLRQKLYYLVSPFFCLFRTFRSYFYWTKIQIAMKINVVKEEHLSDF